MLSGHERSWLRFCLRCLRTGYAAVSGGAFWVWMEDRVIVSVAKRVILYISDERILNGSREKLCVMVFCEKNEVNMLYPCASAGRDIELKEY